MRTITFDGRLGKDAEVLTARNGRQYVRFNVANNMFNDGNERTDWFDVTCYDQFVVDKKFSFLKKGTYVIVTGQILSKVNVSNGNVYQNHYVTASTIEIPRFGRKNDDNYSTKDEPAVVSVYTGGTKSDISQTGSAMASPSIPPVPSPPPERYTPSDYSNSVDYTNNDDDDLPF